MNFDDALLLAQTSYSMALYEKLIEEPNCELPSIKRGSEIVNKNYTDICEMYGDVNFKEMPSLVKSMIEYSSNSILTFLYE